MRRMLAPPFLAENVDARHPRKLTMLKILDWLELHPGKTWQERWNSSGAGTDGTADWRDQAVAELEAAGKLGPRGGELHHVLGTGMVQLIGGDVLRPGLPWLLATTSPSRVAEEMGRTRDPAGIAALKKLREGGTIGRATFAPAVERVALIMAAKGGLVADITPGDCIELLDCCRLLFAHGTRVGRHSPFFYQLLHMAGVFPPGAPATVRMFSVKFAGQLSVEQLVDRYDLACRPVRDCWWTTCANASPASTTTPSSSWPCPWSCASGRTSRTATPASAPCTCRPASPPGGRSASRPGPSAPPAAASRSSPASRQTTS